jgi:hypothetical protein
MNDQTQFIKWLQTDITKKECIMNYIIDIYGDLELYLENNHVYIKEDFNTFLMRLSYFIYKNSTTNAY